jgi:fatty acid desaturase
LLHHRYEHSEADPDDIETITRRKSIPLTLFYYCYIFFGAYIYLVHIAVTGFRCAERREKLDIALEYGAILALLGLALWLAPIDSFLKVWFFPWLVAAQITSFRGLPEHALTTRGDPFTLSRTIVSNRFVRLMMCNANYHLDHHLFPGVPWYHLPKVHALLKTEYERAGSPVFRSYTEFYLEFIKASRAGIVPNVRLIPKAMRESVCR